MTTKLQPRFAAFLAATGTTESEAKNRDYMAWIAERKAAFNRPLRSKADQDAFTAFLTPVYIQLSGLTEREPGHEFTQPPAFWSHDASAVVKSGETQRHKYEATYGTYPHDVYMLIWRCEDLGEPDGSPGHRRLRLVEVSHTIRAREQ